MTLTLELNSTMYLVNDIYPCIQGEGCQTGVPMVLLRLHGCGVGCPWCDTKETWDVISTNQKPALVDALGVTAHYARATASEINAYICTHYPAFRWVLITGGEPARFPLKSLVNALHDGGFKCALETSGTELGHIDAGVDWICVSPKHNMPGGKIVLSDALAVADEIKQVIGKQSDIDLLETTLSNTCLKPSCQICLQPVSQSKKATALCIETVQRKNWRLSLQTHKFINIK